MTYALRHRWWVVLSGVGIASFLVHGLSVTIGHFLGLTLPERPIAFAAAVVFLLFAVWTWRDGRDDGRRGRAVTVAEPRYVLLAVVSSFVLAELGDKTMLATVALASDHNWAGVWIGATAGMVLADGVAIAVGHVLHKRLPERVLHRMAGRAVPAVRPLDALRRRPRLALAGDRHNRLGGRAGDNHGRRRLRPRCRRADASSGMPRESSPRAIGTLRWQFLGRMPTPYFVGRGSGGSTNSANARIRSQAAATGCPRTHWRAEQPMVDGSMS